MVTVLIDDYPRPVYRLPIHFDMETHVLSLDTFIATTREFENSFESLVQEHIGPDLQFKTLVLPPEEGGFKAVLAWTFTVAGGAIAFLETDVGSGFVEGSTGKTPSEWTKEIGAEVRSIYEDVSGGPSVLSAQNIKGFAACGVLVEATKGFFEKPTSELIEAGIEPSFFPEMFAAKNSFYKTCEEDASVLGVGFNDTHEFPVPREFFQTRIAHLPRDDESVWLVQVVEYVVTSPNWDRYDRKRQWKGRDGNGNVVFFTISDNSFWIKIEQDELVSSHLDKIVAQAAIRRSGARSHEIILLNVLSYNDVHLSDALGENELMELLPENAAPRTGTEDLFERQSSPWFHDADWIDEDDEEPPLLLGP